MKPLRSQPTLPLGAAATWLARCTDAEHPTLDGRVRVAFEDTGDEPLELWVPKLAGLAIREGDRVLVTQPANGSEPVAVGVLDGFAQRPKREWRDKAVLALEPDEQIVVESRRGDPLFAVRDSEEGPVVALLGPDVAVEIDGELKLTAKAISLAARQGEARVEARSDVVIRGETIQLN